MSGILERTLIDEKVAAKYLGMSRTWLRKCRCSGIGGPPFHRLGRSIRYSVADLDAWLSENRHDPAVVTSV
jgi:predicted DNA-binding transcriptional regulator AlpA